MRVIARIAAAAMLLIVGAAQAEVYRCVQDGKTVYTDVPCAPGAAPAQLPALQSMSPGASENLEKQYDRDAASQAAATRKARAESADAYAAQHAQDEAIRKGVIEDRVVRGMSREQVERILNEPNRVEGENGIKERWYYVNGRERRTVTFENGVVVAISDRISRRP